MQKNNDSLNELINKITNLDHYTQAAIIGSINFMACASGISAAMRYAPPVLEAEGETPDIDKRNAYDFMRAEMYKNDLAVETIGMWVSVISTLADYAEDHEIDLSDAGSCLEFMASREPNRKQFIAEYDARRKQGCKPQMSVKDFVDGQYKEAMEKHAKMVAYGTDAVRLLNTTPPRDVDLPDWFIERAEEKSAEKCNQRWLKLAARASNPRLKKAARDEAESDMALVRAFMDEIDYEIYADGNAESEEDIDKFLEEAAKLDDVLPVKKMTVVKKAA